ncbi:hypothetical protein K438DRAFT_1996598 [Mycena galopus ATCC 62051]|nr:hypothetical protein K438DRAFT_1996598 [Mycena galopus ATCC 62051]
MEPGDLSKTDQIAFHIYTKLLHVVYAARASEQGQGQGQPQGKVDKWFKLETPLALSAATPAGELDLYRSLSSPYPYPYLPVSASDSASSSLSTSQPPLALQVLLVIPPSSSRGGTAIVHTPTGTRVEPEPRTSASGSSSAGGGASDPSWKSSTEEVLPPTMYRNAIPLFHTLLKLLRILPASPVVRKLTGRKPEEGHRKREWGRETRVSRRRVAPS